MKKYLYAFVGVCMSLALPSWMAAQSQSPEKQPELPESCGSRSLRRLFSLRTVRLFN